MRAHAWPDSRSQCVCVTSGVDVHGYMGPALLCLHSPRPQLRPDVKGDEHLVLPSAHSAPARPAPNPTTSGLFGSLAVVFWLLAQKFSEFQL